MNGDDGKNVNVEANGEAAKRLPLSSGWISLGEGRGIKWALWSTSVVLQRSEKQDEKWITTEELHLAPMVLKELAWRCHQWLNVMDNGHAYAEKRNGEVK